MLTRIISAHEHLGYSRLYFENGTYTEYNSHPDKLKADLLSLKKYSSTRKIGCIIYPQMPYKQYHFSEDYRYMSSKEINEDFYSMINFCSSINWYPFIYLRVTDDWRTNETLIKKYQNKAFGIKLHPDAELAEPEDFIKSKIFDLAEIYNKPITIHCARPGRGMDLGMVYDSLIDNMAVCSIGINLAHIGFLHSYILEKEFPENIYFDLSPFGIIEDNLNYVEVETHSFNNLITRILMKHGQRLMYGEDFPYNLQKWEDGSIHGRSRVDDLKVLLELLNRAGVDPDDIFYNNASRFLNINSN